MNVGRSMADLSSCYVPVVHMCQAAFVQHGRRRPHVPDTAPKGHRSKLGACMPRPSGQRQESHAQIMHHERRKLHSRTARKSTRTQTRKQCYRASPLPPRLPSSQALQGLKRKFTFKDYDPNHHAYMCGRPKRGHRTVTVISLRHPPRQKQTKRRTEGVSQKCAYVQRAQKRIQAPEVDDLQYRRAQRGLCTSWAQQNDIFYKHEFLILCPQQSIFPAPEPTIYSTTCAVYTAANV